MTAQFTLVPVDRIDRLEAQIDKLLRIVERSTVTPAPEWVSVSEAARIEGCSATTIRRMVDAGKLEARGAGKARRVRLVQPIRNV